MHDFDCLFSFNWYNNIREFKFSVTKLFPRQTARTGEMVNSQKWAWVWTWWRSGWVMVEIGVGDLKLTWLTKIKLTWAGGDTLESNGVQSFANNATLSIDIHAYPIRSTRKALLKISWRVQTLGTLSHVSFMTSAQQNTRGRKGGEGDNSTCKVTRVGVWWCP